MELVRESGVQEAARGAVKTRSRTQHRKDTNYQPEERRDIRGFLGFDFRRVKTKQGKWGVLKTLKMKARTNLLRKLKEIFRNHQSQPIDRVIYLINPILRGFGWERWSRSGLYEKLGLFSDYRIRYYVPKVSRA